MAGLKTVRGKLRLLKNWEGTPLPDISAKQRAPGVYERLTPGEYQAHGARPFGAYDYIPPGPPPGRYVTDYVQVQIGDQLLFFSQQCSFENARGLDGVEVVATCTSYNELVSLRRA